MGSGCKHREGYDYGRLLMGGGRMEEGKERSKKILESGGVGGLDKVCNDSNGA